MMNEFLTRFADSPALVCPEQVGSFQGLLSGLSDLVARERELGHDMMADNMSGGFWPESGSWLSQFRPYTVSDGILCIPVTGALLNGFPYAAGYATGYEYIWKAFERGMSDPDVKGIALRVDSPGGAVAGNFDMVDKMFAMRGTKPVQAFASESAYSAAYSIASAADKISVSRTGGVGSIGVVTTHVDYSGAMEKGGVKVTFIYAGAHKVDGNPYQALPDSVKERIQSRIDGMYDIFVSTVARNRGMDEKAVRKTEAATFTATEAVANGLADAVATFEDGIAAFSGEINNGATAMTQNTTEDPTAAINAARQDGMAAGAKAERERIKAIVECDEAVGRRDAAFNIALNSDMSVESSKGLLAVLPKVDDAPKGGASHFDVAMSKGNPEIETSLESPTKASGDDYDAVTNELLSAARAGGVKLKQK